MVPRYVNTIDKKNLSMLTVDIKSIKLIIEEEGEAQILADDTLIVLAIF